MTLPSSLRGFRFALSAFALLSPQLLLAQEAALPVIEPGVITARVPICYNIYCANSVEAMHGSTAIHTSSSGVIEVLTRTGPDIWTATQALFNPDESGPPQGPPTPTFHDFGAPVALDARVLIISGGSRLHPSALYVFTRPGSVWAHAQTIDIPKPAGYFRISIVDVALHDNTAIVLVRYHNSTTAYKQIHVYKRNTGEPFVYQGQIAPALGNRLALQKNTALLIDPRADGNRGAAYTFERVGTQWVMAQKLMGSGTAPGDGFGSSFDFDGNIIVVSAPDQPNLVDPRLPGAVYTFTRYYGSWAEREMLLHEPVTQPEFDYPVRFGERVALSGSRLLVDSGMPIASPPRDPPLVTLYERHDQQWQARAQLGCLDIQDVLIAGNAAFLTYGDYSKPGVSVVPYVLPPLGTAPPPTSFACEF